MGSNSPIQPADVLTIFDNQERPGTPLTAPEVADEIGCARRTAYNKLMALTESGELATKKVGARARVWWRPADSQNGAVPKTLADDRSRTQNEQALRELHDASRRLMQAETHETVCEIAVEAARHILGLSLTGVWRYDSEHDVLEPVEWTDIGVEEYGEPPSFPVDGSLVGRAFREGTFHVYDDITAEQDLYDPETSVRSELILPLGEYGVLNTSSPTVGAFDGVDISLARILAANVETALDRCDQLERRRERRRELKRQRDELETLNQINALVEDTIGALVGAATRDEIESTVCEQLAVSDLYADAWIVTRESSSGTLTLRTGADDDSERSRIEAGHESSQPNPIVTAIEENTLQVIPRVLENERIPEQFQTEVESDTLSCLVVPLTYADTVFGALVVHAPGSDGFSDREQVAFETLGRVVGFAINATNNRRLLLGNTAVELEVALRDTDAWFLSATRQLEGTITIEGLVPTDDGTVIEYVRFEQEEGDPNIDDLVELPAIRETRLLAADDGCRFFECVVREEQSGLGTIVEYGASIRTVQATNGHGRVTIRYPEATPAREVMDRVQETFPTAELVAKKLVDVSDRSVTTMRQRITEQLTEKQSTVLRAAVLAGYYDSPRGTTAQELADSLNIAPSTLYQHLQAAHRKLLTTVFDGLTVD